jgi:chromosome segregation ATPase
MTSEPALATGWAEEELARALARLDTLGREVAQLQGLVGEQRQLAEGLRQALATVEGRTRRHETGQDVALGLQPQLGALEERLYEEAALRRDQAASLEHHQRATGEQLQQLERAQAGLEERLRGLELALAAAVERQQQLVQEVTARRGLDQQLFERQEALAERMGAVATVAQRAAEDQVPLAVALPRIELALRTLDARTTELARAQERGGEELRALRGLADREAVLADLFDQLRALRLHAEERLRLVEERADGLERVAGGDRDQRALLTEHLRAVDVRLDSLARRGDQQRQALLEHFRRMTDAAEAANRRAAEELARQVRDGRQLLVRLAEGSDAAAAEQPL